MSDPFGSFKEVDSILLDRAHLCIDFIRGVLFGLVFFGEHDLVRVIFFQPPSCLPTLCIFLVRGLIFRPFDFDDHAGLSVHSQVKFVLLDLVLRV